MWQVMFARKLKEGMEQPEEGPCKKPKKAGSKARGRAGSPALLDFWVASIPLPEEKMQPQAPVLGARLAEQEVTTAAVSDVATSPPPDLDSPRSASST